MSKSIGGTSALNTLIAMWPCSATVKPIVVRLPERLTATSAPSLRVTCTLGERRVTVPLASSLSSGMPLTSLATMCRTGFFSGSLPLRPLATE